MPSQNNIVYQKDMEFGFSEEDRVKVILEKYYGTLRTLEKFNSFDFENDEYLIELKSRRIRHDKYPTAMVNYSKILKSADSEKIRVVVFNYEDGLYYWNIDNTEYTVGKGGRCDRGCDEYYTMAFIKKEFLQSIDDLGHIIITD
tara:strand:+ start:1103 stop:1534 length:432 start_codon:yes stop_codon:yes gene_type:complete